MAGSEITLTFWHTYGDAEEAQFLNVVLPLWEAAHPNIKIEAVRQDGGVIDAGRPATSRP